MNLPKLSQWKGNQKVDLGRGRGQPKGPTFLGQLRTEHLLLRAFLEGAPSEMLSRGGVLDEAVMKKLKEKK